MVSPLIFRAYIDDFPFSGLPGKLDEMKDILISDSCVFSGEFQIGNNIKPLDPKSVSSVVRFGRLSHSLSHRASGYSLVYSQLYPFDGLQNYTSGIIHHVRLTGFDSSIFVSSIFRTCTVFFFLFFFVWLWSNLLCLYRVRT